MENNDDWVTNSDALKTIIALNAIQVGDFVRISVKGTTLPVAQEGEHVVTDTLPYAGSWGKAGWAQGEPVILEVNGFLYSERSIVGWKPAKR